MQSQFIRDPVEFQFCPFKDLDFELEKDGFVQTHKARGGVQTPPYRNSLNIWQGLIPKKKKGKKDADGDKSDTDSEESSSSSES